MNKKVTSKILICLGINMVIASIAIFVFGTDIHVEDDYNIAFMAYGIVTRPSAHVYYTNYILGGIYKRLFELVPCFNWQTLIYYLGLIFSGTVGLYTVWMKKNRMLVMFWFLFELVFFHEVYVFLTFSVVAAFVASQAYLVLFLITTEDKPSIWLYIAGGLSLVFSSMVRFDSFLGISGFAAFIWLILAFLKIKQDKDVRSFLSKYCCPFLVIIVACFVLWGIDRASYESDYWKVYKDNESARHIVTDYRNSISESDFETLEEMGINHSMAMAVAEYRHDDPEILTLEVLEKMAGTAKSIIILQVLMFGKII